MFVLSKRLITHTTNFMNTPKSLADLKYEQFSHTITGSYSDVEAYAKEWFLDMEGNKLTINYLFTEGDARVYECYVDSGSVDYLYVELYTTY